MSDQLVASVRLTWPLHGKVSHEYVALNIDPSNEQNVIPLLSAFLFASQAGSLPPWMALTMCSRAISLCEREADTVIGISRALSYAELDLLQRPDKSVYHTYHPHRGPVGNKEGFLWGTEQLVTNFADYAVRQAPPALATRLKAILLISIKEFLSYLEQDIQLKLVGYKGTRSPRRLIKHMNEFSDAAVYRLWTTIDFDPQKIAALVPDDRQLHSRLCTKIGISPGWQQLDPL